MYMTFYIMRKKTLLAQNIQHKIHNKKNGIRLLMHKTEGKEFELNPFYIYDDGKLALSPA